MSAYNPVKARTRLLARYGLKPEDYARLFLAQGGGCAICGRAPTGRMLDVDHDHASKEVRGLLCFLCNKGLGYFRSVSMEGIRCIADYLTPPYTGYFVPKKRRTRRAGQRNANALRGTRNG